MDQSPVHCKQQPACKIVAHRERKRARRSFTLQYVETGLPDSTLERTECKQPLMRQIENAALTVIELAEQEHQARYEERHVCSADDDLGRRVRAQGYSEFVEKKLRPREML